ncbi:hypothetical protein IFM51744_09412 [Aspergillus udagawae]|nr:hypothetical protein IFM51744_09412 [Aspergillus udagawae]
MAEQTTDALGNSVRFVNDYTHLQPARITDANQNTYGVMLSPLGEAIAVAVLGKPTSTAAACDVDSLDCIDPDVCEADIQAVLAEPDGPVARRLLGNAGSRTIPVRDAFVRAREPTFTITISRDRSFRQPGEATLHVVVTYLQGSGSGIQQAVLNEGTEWLISEVRCRRPPIRVFDPFFTSTPAYVPVDKCTSSGLTAFYGIQGHCIARLAPDHSWTKTVYTPWTVVQWHEGDTLPITDPRDDSDVRHYFSSIAASCYLLTWLEQQGLASAAVTQSKVYASQTPVTTHLGCHPATPRIRSVHKAGNGQTFTLSFWYDAAGNQTHSWDNLERLTETALYDKLGRPIQACGMDAGDKYTIPDVAGAPIALWNSRGVCYHYTYDAFRRETGCWLLVMPASLTGQKAEAKLVVQTLFGESCDSYAEAVTANLRGRVWKIRDQSGEHTQLDMIFETRAEFDNFSSPVWEVDVQRNETRRVFSRRGHASKVEVRHVSKPDEWQTYLVDTTFDGLPLSITYGNGTRTTFTYHPQSRHLLTQWTLSLKPGNGRKGEEAKEDLSFAYDIVGRRVSRSNKADKPVFVGGTRINADFTYSCDVIGQLVSATGRRQLPAGVTRLQPHSAMSGNTDRVGPAEGDRTYN